MAAIGFDSCSGRLAEAFADEDELLAPFPHRAELRRRRGQRPHGHVVANRLDLHRRIVGVLLLEVVARRVIAFASLEVLDRRDERGLAARERQAAGRRQRVHDRDHVLRRQLVDEVDERLAHDHVVAAAHVIVVEQHDEEPDVRLLGFELLIRLVQDLFRLEGQLLRQLVDLDDVERVDLLRPLVFANLEVVGLHVEDDVAGVLVGDDDVDTDEVDAAADDRTLVLRLLLVGRRRSRRGRRGRLLGLRDQQSRGEKSVHSHSPMITSHHGRTDDRARPAFDGVRRGRNPLP
jgi:hypothetical protein